MIFPGLLALRTAHSASPVALRGDRERLLAATPWPVTAAAAAAEPRLADAVGGEIFFLQVEPKGSLLDGSWAATALVSDYTGRALIRSFVGPSLLRAVAASAHAVAAAGTATEAVRVQAAALFVNGGADQAPPLTRPVNHHES